MSNMSEIANDNGEVAPFPSATNLLAYLAESTDATSDWRRQKSAEYPDDDRNEPAAIRLEMLSKDLYNSDAEAYPRLSTLVPDFYADDATDLDREVNDYISRIGFDHFPDTASEFLNDLCDIAEDHRRLTALAQAEIEAAEQFP